MESPTPQQPDDKNGWRPRPPGSRLKRLPPRWFIRLFWQLHRALIRVSGGHLGLWRPTKGWGTLRLTTTGRRTGQPRHVVLAYLQDGPNLFTLAMNGWDPAEPAWWLNLQAEPEAHVELAGSQVERGVAHRRPDALVQHGGDEAQHVHRREHHCSRADHRPPPCALEGAGKDQEFPCKRD